MKEEMSMMMDYRYHNQLLPIPEVDYHQQGGQFFPGVPGGNVNQHQFSPIPEVDYRQQGGQFFPGVPGGNVNQRLTRLERQFDRLDREVNQLDRRVDRIERRLGIRQESEF
jgi:hypothetical protein